jgi:hypothetical protein
LPYTNLLRIFVDKASGRRVLHRNVLISNIFHQTQYQAPALAATQLGRTCLPAVVHFRNHGCERDSYCVAGHYPPLAEPDPRLAWRQCYRRPGAMGRGTISPRSCDSICVHCRSIGGWERLSPFTPGVATAYTLFPHDHKFII